MGNFGCFQDKSQGFVSLKVRPVDQKADEEKRQKLAKMTEDELKFKLYEEQNIIQGYIKNQILSATATKDKKNQALEETFVHWNDLSLVIQYLRQAQVTKQLHAQQSNIKKLRETEGIQMVLVKENNNLKSQIQKSISQYKILSDQFLKYQGEASAKIKEANDNVQAYFEDYQQKTNALNAEISKLKEDLSKFRQQQQKSKLQKQKIKEENIYTLGEIDKYKQQIQSLREDQSRTIQQMEGYKIQINKSRRQIQRLQEDISKSHSQIQTIRQKELESKDQNDRNYQRIETENNQSKQQIESLKEQLQKKEAQIQELRGNQQNSEVQFKNQLQRSKAENKQLKQEIDTKTSQLLEINKQLEDLQSQLETKNDELTNLKRQNGKLHDDDAQYQHTIQENSTLKEKIIELQTKNSELIQESSSQIDKINQQFSFKLSESEEKIKQEMILLVNDERDKSQALKEELRRTQQQNKQLQAKKGQLTQEMVNKFVSDIKAEKQKNQQLLKQMDQVRAQKMKSVQGILTQLQNYKKSTSNTVNQKNNTINELEGKLQALKAQLKRSKQQQVQENTSNAQIEELNNVNQQLKNQIEKILNEKRQLQYKKNELQNKINLDQSSSLDLQTQIQNLRNSNSQLKDQLQALLRNESKKGEEQIKIHQRQISQKQQQIQRVNKQLEQKIVEIRELRNDSQSNKSIISKLQQEKSNLQSQTYAYYFSLTILPMSQIVEDAILKQTFKEMMMPKNLSTSKLLYRATQRWFLNFHDICDQRDNIAVFVKSNGRIFGCYTQHGFIETNNKPDNDQQSFIFSLTDNLKFPIAKGKVAAIYDPNMGPAFGKDLQIVSNQGSSKLGERFIVDPNYNISNPSEFLAGASKFSIDEYEVYALWFS